MSVLASEVYEYLSRTKRKMDLRGLYSKFLCSRPLMMKTLQEMVESRKLETISIKGRRIYKAIETGEPAAKPAFYQMRPYVPPAALTARQREIEAQRAEFPSRFD